MYVSVSVCNRKRVHGLGGKLYLHLLFMICRTRSEVLIQIVHRPKIICKQFAVNACSIIKIVDILCLIAIARS